VLLIIAVISLFWVPQGRIQAVEITGTQALSTSSIEGYVKSELSGRYLYLFPKNSALLYPKGAIEKGLSQEFSTIKTVSVGLRDLHTLQVTIVERRPDALWCGEIETANVPSCYLLDGSGTVYALGATYSGDAYVLYYGPVSSTTQKQYLDPSTFQSLHALVEALKGKDTPQRVYVDENRDVHVTFVDGFVLLFSLSQNSGDIVSRFSLALTADPFTTHPLSDFEYLDLRFGDKLYYKLKGK